MGMDIIMVDTIPSVLVAAHTLLTVSGAFVSATAGTRRDGRCEQDWSNQQGRPNNFDPFVECLDSSTCQRMDMNLICNTNITMQAGGKCECRSDMKWNTQNSECQLYMDVDCSSITYDTEPSPVILEAVNKTLERIAENNKTSSEDLVGE